jgi:hypothetical protein
VANADRSRSSSNADLKRSPSVTRATGLNSHPVMPDLKAHSKPNGPIPRAPMGTMANAKTRGSIPQARDARVPRESIIDFADFIRTTGPPGDNTPKPIRSTTAPIAVAKMSTDSGSRASMNRPRLQARDASIDSREDNSDLIDFIRRGPPSGPNNPRIPRTVAPFRTTMDSDQLSNLVGGKAVDATLPDIRYSQASTNVTDMSMPSMHSSITSQSALIKNRSPMAQSGSMFDEEDMMPKRKTRRVRDPYAIDLSDEDEDEEFERRPRPPAKQEESLAEFLKNYQPPPEPPAVEPIQRPKKKASAPSLMARFGRGNSSNNNSSNANSINAAESRSLSSRSGGGRGYIPIQVNMPPGYDKYGPIEIKPAKPSTSTVNVGNRVPMKKFEPREAVSSSTTRTSDLAAFLRNSEPPPQMSGGASYSPTFEQDDSNGLSRMFGRRKKSTGFA